MKTRAGLKYFVNGCSSTGYLCKFDFYLGRRKYVEINLGKSVMMHMSEKLIFYCTLFFDSLVLIYKLLEDGIYAIGTVQSNQKQMPKLKGDKKMSRDFQDEKFFIILKTLFAANSTITSLFFFWQTNVDGMSGICKVMRRTNGPTTKMPISCFNIIKL